jgi:hypothetical protein
MFRLLYTASERVAKRAGFCVGCWLRSLPATPLRLADPSPPASFFFFNRRQFIDS